MLLRNQLYAGIVAVPEYGVRNQRGDFDPLVSEDVIFRAQAVLSGRPPIAAPKLRSHPDFPLSNFGRCEACGRGLTGSWSKGRSESYAYYHCRPGCRGVSVTKAKLEGLFADELSRLQPTPGYMRLLKESVLQIWKTRQASVRADVAAAERSTITALLDRPLIWRYHINKRIHHRFGARRRCHDGDDSFRKGDCDGQDGVDRDDRASC